MPTPSLILVNDTQEINYQLDSMRQFQDDLTALNILARERTNNDMIQVIHAENPQIREIQQENRQLKASIEEHQRAIELIMSKYREHTQRQIQETKLDFDKLAKANENNNVSSLRLVSLGCATSFLLVFSCHQCTCCAARGSYFRDAGSCADGRQRHEPVLGTAHATENRKPRYAGNDLWGLQFLISLHSF